MSVLGILSVPNHQFNGAHAAAHPHRTTASMHQPSAAEGGKLRRVARLLLAASVVAVGVSTLALRLPLPTLSRVTNGPDLVVPSSSVPLVEGDLSRMRNLSRALLWGQCQVAPALRIQTDWCGAQSDGRLDQWNRRHVYQEV